MDNLEITQIKFKILDAIPLDADKVSIIYALAEIQQDIARKIIDKSIKASKPVGKIVFYDTRHSGTAACYTDEKGFVDRLLEIIRDEEKALISAELNLDNLDDESLWPHGYVGRIVFTIPLWTEGTGIKWIESEKEFINRLIEISKDEKMVIVSAELNLDKP